MQTLEYLIGNLGFPCVGAKTALSLGQISTYKAHDLRCPADDEAILARASKFIADYERDKALYSSLIIIFAGPAQMSETEYESALWARLTALHRIDRASKSWDATVSSDPAAPDFSFSLGGRAFYAVGLHPGSSRKARQFSSPAIVLNLHAQFERLRKTGAYETMQKLIRRRDTAYSGSVNPMLADFGDLSEARQYSGRAVGADWVCPFKEMNG